MRKPAAETCKVCGAPRARKESGVFYSSPLCPDHLNEERRKWRTAHAAKKAAAQPVAPAIAAGQPLAVVAPAIAAAPEHQLRMNLAIDLAIAAGESVSTISCLIAEWLPGTLPAPRRRRRFYRPLRLHAPLRRMIVAPDYATSRIVYVRGRIVRSVPMPSTYGEVKKQLLDHHHDGHYIAQ